MAGGSGASFERFVAEREAPLLRTAVFLAGDRGRGEDLLQDVLLAVFRRWGRIDDPEAYVRRALVNAATSRWRRPRVREEPLGPAADRGVSSDADRLAERAELLAALRVLPPRQRAVVVLRYFDDLSEAQIATLLACSPGSVKTHCARGLKRLRAILDTGDLTWSEGGAR